jgi:hypothetical protein
LIYLNILSKPSISSIWSRWAPPLERSRLAGMASAGSWIGNIIALPLAGYLCLNGFYNLLPYLLFLFYKLVFYKVLPVDGPLFFIFLVIL